MTMRTAALILALAASPAAATQGDPFQPEYVYMLSAGELRGAIDQGNQVMVIGYISGVMDALMHERAFCVPAGASPGVIGARVFRLMGQQPRESRAPAADVIAVFLRNDYPCRR